MPFVDPITSTSAASPTSPGSTGLQRAARAALALLAFALPFELVRPLGHVGPLQLTSVELVLYVALALSAIAIAARVLPDVRRMPWRQLATRHAGVILFAVVLLLSAARAPLARPDAIKFALRNVGGIALYVAAANLLRAPAAALTTSVAMTIGAVVAASLMWAELHVPGAAAALVPFHARSFDVFGLPRASGPFQYPNIAAMYLEGALPVVLAAGVALDAHRGFRSRWGTVAATIAAAVLVEALSLTASRAAIVTVVVVVAAVGLHALVRKTPGRWRAPVVLGVVGLLAAANTAIGSLAGVRMKFWNDTVWYRSAIVPVDDLPAGLQPKAETAIDVDVRNAGVRPWPAAGAKRVALAYHWYDEETGRLVVFDGLRTGLPHDVDAGVTVRLGARVRAPAQPGRYRLHLELVHEGVTWFGEQGDAGYDAIIDVSEKIAATAPRRQLAAATIPASVEAPLERATRMMLCRTFFVVNQTRTMPDLKLGGWISAAARRRLGHPFDYLGHVESDETVWLAARRRRSLVAEYPEGKASKNIERLGRRILSLDSERDPERPPTGPLRLEEEQTYYEILETEPGVSDEEIRRAYRAIKEIYATGSLVVAGLYDDHELAELHARVNAAHDTLFAPERRRVYDLALPEADLARAVRAAANAGRRAPAAVGAPEERPDPSEALDPSVEVTGELLRKLRVTRGIELGDIAQRTKISERYLRAIEEERFSDMPAAVYVRGYVMEYARALRIDPQRVVESYLARYRKGATPAPAAAPE